MSNEADKIPESPSESEEYKVRQEFDKLKKRAGDLALLQGYAGVPLKLNQEYEIVPEISKKDGEKAFLDVQNKRDDSRKFFHEKLDQYLQTRIAEEREANELPKGTVEIKVKSDLNNLLKEMIAELSPAHKEYNLKEENWSKPVRLDDSMKQSRDDLITLIQSGKGNPVVGNLVGNERKDARDHAREVWHKAEIAAVPEQFVEALKATGERKAPRWDGPQMKITNELTRLAENDVAKAYEHVRVRESLMKRPEQVSEQVVTGYEAIRDTLTKQIEQKLSADEKKDFSYPKYIEKALGSLKGVETLTLPTQKVDEVVDRFISEARGKENTVTKLRADRAQDALFSGVQTHAYLNIEDEKQRYDQAKEISARYAKQHGQTLAEHPQAILRNNGMAIVGTALAGGAAIAASGMMQKSPRDPHTNDVKLDEQGEEVRKSTIFSRVTKVVGVVAVGVAALALADRMATGGQYTKQAVESLKNMSWVEKATKFGKEKSEVVTR